MPEVESTMIGQETWSRIELEIDDGEPIRGQLSASGMGALPFYGWLELAMAIQTIRKRPVTPEA